jgi:hypothetical protein
LEFVDSFRKHGRFLNMCLLEIVRMKAFTPIVSYLIDVACLDAVGRLRTTR